MWAATGQGRRKNIVLPDIVKEVIIFAENSTKEDDPTTESARRSFIDQDKIVHIHRPEPQFSDDNDELMGRVTFPEKLCEVAA